MQQTNPSQGLTREAYDFLVGLYPSHQVSTGEFDTYAKALRFNLEELLNIVVSQATVRWPKWFPSAGDLQSAVRVLAQERVMAERRSRCVNLDDWDGTLETLEGMYPGTDFKMINRDLPAGHCATKLAIDWAKEDRDRTGWRPGHGRPQNTPRRICQERLPILMMMLEGMVK